MRGVVTRLLPDTPGVPADACAAQAVPGVPSRMFVAVSAAAVLAALD